MGYPMTWQRFVKRSRLTTGTYTNPGEHGVRCNLGDHATGPGPIEDFYAGMGPHYVEELKRFEGEFRMLLGDLRRLEADAVDENSILRQIERRTGIEPDVIAAVLKEFFAL